MPKLGKDFNVTFSDSPKNAAKAALAGAGLAVAAVFTATSAAAAPPKPFGTMEQSVGPYGNEVADITVKSLQPSGNNDGIWYSDVTIKSVKGHPPPHIGAFNAVAPDGTSYTAVLGGNPDGIPDADIPQGQSRSGRVYFGVKGGPAPNSVNYTPIADGEVLLWKS